MVCEQARRLISARDGGLRLQPRLRGHLRGCQGCAAFRAGIASRQEDLRLLAPPLPAAGATAVLNSVIGRAHGGSSGILGLLGGGGKGLVGSVALKAATAAAIAATAAAIVAHPTLTVHWRGRSRDGAAQATRAPGPPANTAVPHSRASGKAAGAAGRTSPHALHGARLRARAVNRQASTHSGAATAVARGNHGVHTAGARAVHGTSKHDHHYRPRRHRYVRR